MARRRTPDLVCQGRPVDDAGQPYGDPCGATFSGYAVATPSGWPGKPTAAQVADQARAAGWSVTGPPMCGRCRKPDPAIARGLTRSAPADRTNPKEH